MPLAYGKGSVWLGRYPEYSHRMLERIAIKCNWICLSLSKEKTITNCKFRNDEVMKSIYKQAIGLLLAVSLSVFVNGRANENPNHFLQGLWLADHAELKSISFMEGGLVRVVSKGDQQDVAMQMHYELIGVDKETKTLEVALLQKEVVAERYDQKYKLNFTIQDENKLVLQTQGLDGIALNRAPEYRVYR